MPPEGSGEAARLEPRVIRAAWRSPHRYRERGTRTFSDRRPGGTRLPRDLPRGVPLRCPSGHPGGQGRCRPGGPHPRRRAAGRRAARAGSRGAGIPAGSDPVDDADHGATRRRSGRRNDARGLTLLRPAARRLGAPGERGRPLRSRPGPVCRPRRHRVDLSARARATGDAPRGRRRPLGAPDRGVSSRRRALRGAGGGRRSGVPDPDGPVLHHGPGRVPGRRLARDVRVRHLGHPAEAARRVVRRRPARDPRDERPRHDRDLGERGLPAALRAGAWRAPPAGGGSAVGWAAPYR